MRIAVTATGGGVGQSIIKALKETDHEIIALDSNIFGAGLYMTKESYLIPESNNGCYISELSMLCYDKKIDMLFPGMDCELMKLSINKESFRLIGTKIIISRPEVIEIADDKFLTQQFLKDNDLPYLETKETFNYILKQKTGGARSRGVKNISSTDYVNYVIQEGIAGDEYTCGTITLNGKYYGCIVMRRILRDGDTYKAFVERNKAIENLCEKVCTILKPEGAFNIQLRLKDGVPYIFEFNARCSGTTAARALAGFNEPKMITDYYFNGIEPKYDIKEINILRYWNELVVKKLK